MGRSQRHKVIEQIRASNDELIAQGAMNPTLQQELDDYLQTSKPVLSSLNPDTASITDPDFTISCIGENFTADSVIVWMGQNEPTTLVSPTEVTTLVVPSVVSSPTTIDVFVSTSFQGYPVDTETLTFTWTA